MLGRALTGYAIYAYTTVMTTKELCRKCGVNPCMEQRTVCRQCRSQQEADRKFAHLEMCEYCNERPRMKQRKRCEICDPLCRDCNERPRMHRNYTCGPCHNERLRIRYTNDPKFKEQSNTRTYAWRAQNRRELVAAIHEIYGGRCACPPCGESEPLFLEIDHVNNDGNLDRKNPGHQSGSTTFLRKLVKAGVPLPEYQLLCSNCNQGKRRNGGICPHVVPASELHEG